MDGFDDGTPRLRPPRHLPRGFFFPATGQAICIFHAGSAADVTAVNQMAGVPAADVAEAIDMRAATRETPNIPICTASATGHETKIAAPNGGYTRGSRL